MPRETSETQKAVIIHLHQQGLGYKIIVKQTGATKSTVRYTIKRFQETGEVKNRLRSGRPPCTSPRERRTLVRLSKLNRFASSTELAAKLKDSTGGKQLAASTVRGILVKYGLRARRPRKKPFLNERQRVRRYRWAREHLNWTDEQWRKVIWSDESNFNLQNHAGQITVRRGVGEAFKSWAVLPTVKHPTTVMIWGCFSFAGLGRIDFCNGRMNAAKYITTLERKLLPSAEDMFGEDNRDWTFQQDNAPCHTARVVKTWFQQNDVTVMEWPAQSPDLNPIENLWQQIKVIVCKQKPTTERRLKECIITAWHHVIKEERLHTLVNSMKRRCQAVIKAKGNPTKS